MGDDATEPDDPGRDLDAPDDADVADEYTERFIDRFAQGAIGTAAGAAMVGLEKGMGLYKPVQEAVEIREAGEPEPDPDDPIQVSIDPEHPENSRIVYRMPRDGSDGA
jgi:hypothetical protein